MVLAVVGYCGPVVVVVVVMSVVRVMILIIVELPKCVPGWAVGVA